MNTEHSTNLTTNILVVLLGLAVVSLVYVVATGHNVTMPIISTDRAALVVLLVIGIAMCAMGGIGKAISSYGWLSPVTIIGSVVGILILLMVGGLLLGVKMPLITDDRMAFMLLTGMIVAKVVLNVAVWLFDRGTVI